MNGRFWTFLLLAAAMTATVSYKIVRAESTRREGTLFRCSISGFDPGDPFRGSYLRFTMPSEAMRGTIPATHRRGMVFVTLKTDTNGMVIFDRISAERPQTGDYLEVNPSARRYLKNQFQPPFERWFVPEKSAKQAEKLLQDAQRRRQAVLLFRVRNGFAVIEDIELAGQSLARLAKTKL